MGSKTGRLALGSVSEARASRGARRRVPRFSLYGDRSEVESETDPLHIEDIQSRSRKYLWRIGAHSHTQLCQCVYLATGAVSVEIEDTRVDLAGPALITVPSGIVHGFRFTPDSQGYVLTVDGAKLLSSTKTSHHAAMVALFSAPRTASLQHEPQLAERLQGLLNVLLQEFRRPESVDAPVIEWLACSVLWVLASAAACRPEAGAIRRDLDRLRRFRLLIDRHYLERWSVTRYAERLALSGAGLNRLCRHLSGATALALIQRRRFLEARRRLLYVAGSIATIGAQLGFKDAAYFCRFFRRHAGVSPSLFRRRHGRE